MEKNILPVILLKNIILLPHNELRLEFEDSISKDIIDIALLSNNTILTVTQLDVLEEQPTVEDLPMLGVVATIKSRLELPNGKTRVILEGVSRALVNEYKEKKNIEASITILNDKLVEDEVSFAVGKKLKKELDNYVKVVPYISNSVICKIDESTSLSVLTDVVANHLPISIDRKIQYINCYEPLKRTEMILEDIYRDEESFEIEKKLDTLVKEEIDKNHKEYILKEKLQLIKAELGDISLRESEIFELRKKISLLKAPSSVKAKLERELERYSSLPSTSNELGMVRDYIECLLSLPWDKKTCETTNLTTIKDSLDKTHFGLTNVKERFIEYLAVSKISSDIKSPIICLVGPPGVGKTTLAMSIASSLNRNFSKISVGGMSDEAEIRGHRRTYIGAYPGRIMESIRNAKSSNPVILIDEVDKMVRSNTGDPVSALLEVLDKSQNKHFHDHYIDIDYDISDVMFILTANDIDNIPYPLLDRLEVIYLSEYTEYEKFDIAKNYIVPKLCKEYNLSNITMENKFILNVIRNYTKEAGVRQLEREISTILRKIVTKMVFSDNYKKSISLKEKDIEKYLGRCKYKNVINTYNQVGVVSALSYTPYGGEVMPIEVNYYGGSGNLTLTGSLGKVMQESALIAFSYVKSMASYFEINYQDLVNNDIHVHLPFGAVNKDGPSAGVTLATSIISAFKGVNFTNDIAMTGELTLRGKVLPVGGIREKCLGAVKNNIKKIFIPIGNKEDINALPKSIKNKLDFIFVDEYKQIYDYLININERER